MTRTVPYDPTKAALFRPGEANDFFERGRPATEPALCAELSRLAYCRRKDAVGQILAGIGFASTEFFATTEWDENGTQALLTTGGDLAVLAFRGTESDDLTDIVVDAKFLPVDWRTAGRVHGGFGDVLNDPDDVWPDISRAMEEVNTPRLLFTGHSLGAALATLAASLHRPASLYTFGSPYVGDGEFRDAMNDVAAHRYVDCCDLVTRVPPKLYEHVGLLHYIDRFGNVSREPDDEMMNEDQSIAWREYLFEYEGWRRANVAVRNLADHAPINYVSPLIAAE